MAAYRQVYDSVTCRLTAKNRDQLWNRTLGNRVWANCFIIAVQSLILVSHGRSAGIIYLSV